MSNKPASTIRQFFPITATIWRNETAEGKAWYSVKIERQYKDGQGNWQSTDSYSGDDLLVAAKLFDLAHTEISRFRNADRQATADERTPGQEG